MGEKQHFHASVRFSKRGKVHYTNVPPYDINTTVCGRKIPADAERPKHHEKKDFCKVCYGVLKGKPVFRVIDGGKG